MLFGATPDGVAAAAHSLTDAQEAERPPPAFVGRDEQRWIRSRGLLRPDAIQALYQRAKRGDFLAAKRLFALVNLECWFERYVPDYAFGQATPRGA